MNILFVFANVGKNAVVVIRVAMKSLLCGFQVKILNLMALKFYGFLYSLLFGFF